MFGYPLYVEKSGLKVTLRPPTVEDLPAITKGFANQRVHLYTLGQGAQTLQQETEWFNRRSNSTDEYVWLIEVDGKQIGITGLHHLDLSQSCETGVVIWDQSYWGKGVASLAHMARTYYAADHLNRLTIRSHARVTNLGSVNALKRVGYAVTGIQPRTHFVEGRYLDTYVFVWLHPEKTAQLFPEGVPAKYKSPIVRAQKTLDQARKLVSY